MRSGHRRRFLVLAVFLLLLVIGSTVIAAPYGSRSLYVGRVGADVAELQSRLNRLGYSAGAADGIFGQRTSSALAQFQAATGLVEDGVAEQWDFQALDRAVADRSATPQPTPAPAPPPATDPAPPVATESAPPAAEPAAPVQPAASPPPVVVSRPGPRWVLPSLTLVNHLIIEPPPPVPQPLPPLPAGKRPIVGYYAEDWLGDSRALDSLRSAGADVDRIVNFQLQVDGAGNLSSRPYPELLAEAGARGIKVYGLVHNLNANGFDSEVARALLSDAAVRSHAVDQILQAVRSFGLAGIDIDIENVPPEQRENYTALVRELAERLRPAGYGLSLSIPAKTFDDRTSAWSGAFDYAALGQYADWVAIMAYDEHTPGWGAGPIASLGWVERVAAYASSQIDPQKLLLGIAAYGYDWEVGTTRARGLSAPGAAALAQRYGAPVQWDATAQVPYFTYSENGFQRIVYFENAASTAAKLDLVGKYNLAGIAIWRLGLEDPAIWPVIAAKLR